jgi:hypothetical protein
MKNIVGKQAAATITKATPHNRVTIRLEDAR